MLGSGIAGSTISKLLSKNNSVTIFDKARGPGGRSSNKRLGPNLSFDHGVQYISPQTKQFQKFILDLKKKGVLKIWEGNHLDFTFKKKENKLRYIGKEANNAICKHQIKKIKQNYFSPITKLNFRKKYWEVEIKNGKKYFFKSLVITCPYPQLIKLARKYLNKNILNFNVKMEPNITLMLAVKNQKKIPISSIKLNDDIISWIAIENSKKRFKSKLNLWTLQATLKWSKKNINHYKTNKKITNYIISRFVKITGIDKKNIIFKKMHGWKYSYNYKKTNLKSFWNKKYKLGICGDWFLGPKVEHAWLSASDLYKKIKKNPS